MTKAALTIGLDVPPAGRALRSEHAISQTILESLEIVEQRLDVWLQKLDAWFTAQVVKLSPQPLKLRCERENQSGPCLLWLEIIRHITTASIFHN